MGCTWLHYASFAWKAPQSKATSIVHDVETYHVLPSLMLQLRAIDGIPGVSVELKLAQERHRGHSSKSQTSAPRYACSQPDVRGLNSKCSWDDKGHWHSQESLIPCGLITLLNITRIDLICLLIDPLVWWLHYLHNAELSHGNPTCISCNKVMHSMDFENVFMGTPRLLHHRHCNLKILLECQEQRVERYRKRPLGPVGSESG